MIHLDDERRMAVIVDVCCNMTEEYVKERVCAITRGEMDAFSAGFLAALEKQGVVKKGWMRTSVKTPRAIRVAMESTSDWCGNKLMITWGEKVAYTDGFYSGSDTSWKEEVERRYVHQSGNELRKKKRGRRWQGG